VAEHLASGGVEIWLLTVAGTPAGYFELHRTAHEVEICYFGLLPEFIGQRLGPALLTVAVREAWASEPERVWLHTCSLDHPSAVRNYERVGFVPYRQEQYDARIPVDREL
jgi:GNAT superfamily N-acetyltransferase